MGQGGVVLENQLFSKVLVRVDGSRRVTTRNRRFLKAILPPIRRGGVNQDVQSLNNSPDDDDDDEDYHHLVQQPLQQPPVAQQQGRQDLTAIEDRQEPEMEELMIPQSPPHAQGPPNPGVGGGLQRDELPEDLHPPQDGAGSPLPPEVENARPRRNTRPPVRYTDYDLSTLKTMVSEISKKLSDLSSR